MDMILFKETVRQHSSRLKEEDSIEFKLNSTINEASYYNSIALDKVDEKLSMFKEKLNRNPNISDKLFKEGLADIGKTIWNAILKVLQQIVRVAVNVRMWVNGGEKSLVKRIDKVIAKINSRDDFTGIVALPVLKGDKGMKGYYNIIGVMANLISGRAYVNGALDGNIIEWVDAPSGNGIMDIIIKGMRAVDGKLGTDDINIVSEKLTALNKSATKGINRQLFKSLSNADTLKGIYTVKKLDHISKTSAVQALKSLKMYINNAFAKTEFEKNINVLIKTIKTSLKSGSVKADVKLQGIAKVGLHTLNIILNDYLNIVKDIKLALLNIMKSIEKGGDASSKSYNSDYVDAIKNKGNGITDTYRNAVKDGKVRPVRIMLKDSMIVDPTLKQFNEMFDIASGMEGLIDTQFEGRPLSENESNWTKSYMDKLMVQLVGNFCFERIEHLEKVVSYIYKDEIAASNASDSKIISIPYFVESCNKQDTFAVKSIMADMVKRVKGDKAQLDEAIKYAESKGAFEWDEFDKHDATTKWDSALEEYNFEKERLVQNFSKVRYERVIKLYKQVYGGK